MTIIAGILLLAAQAQTAATPAVPTTAAATPTAPSGLLIPQDTPVDLMALREVSTASAAPGTPIKLTVNKPVVLGGRTLIPAGTPAFGEVTAARDAGGLGKSGVMSAKLTHIQLGDTRVPIDGTVNSKGTGSGSAGVAVLLTGVMGLFHRGNNAKIKAGEIISGFVADDVTLPVAP